MVMKSCTIFMGPELDTERIMSRNLHEADPMRCSARRGRLAPATTREASYVSWWEKRQEDSDPEKTEGKSATN